VAIVVYAGSAGEVLPSTCGSDRQKIREALDKLSAGGSTAGGAGIQLAYKIAKNNFIKNGNNRIILCTDGDFNVGVSSAEGLETLIENERKSGVFLTVLGYGMGNYKDKKMQVLAQKGNGNHAYIDNLQEANKVLVNEFGSTMCTVAKDVKLQVEFNPEHVQAYRLIGYESRLLKDEDFNDDTKDAGEMGAGHCVTAFYEIVPLGVKFTGAGRIDDLKYQISKKPAEKVSFAASPEMLTVKLRYKEPDGNVSKKIELPLIDSKTNNISSDFRFAAAVAMFAQMLTDSSFKGDATFDKVIELAKTALSNDEYGYRREFVRLVQSVKGISE
jgi:Ca-activated chloride channel family protein